MHVGCLGEVERERDRVLRRGNGRDEILYEVVLEGTSQGL